MIIKGKFQHLIPRRSLEEGKCIPKWYGRAYYDFDRDIAVCYPYGIHLLVWFWHEKLRYFLRFPPRDKEMHRVYLEGKANGYYRGWNACIDRYIKPGKSGSM